MYLGMKTKKRSLSQMRLSGMGPVAFFWGTIFALGAQNPPLTLILPSYSGEDQKKKRKKVFFENTLQWHRSCCFLLGHDFCLGAQKPSLVRILSSHLGVKTKNKTKRSITNAPQWCRSCCFLLRHNSHSFGGHGPEMTSVAPSLHGCFYRKFTALVL